MLQTPDPDAPTIVAVGASAGGLDAFSQLLDHLPPDPDVAFVLIQHLSPEHESSLAALLSSRTRLPVVVASDGIDIETNHVYVIPPNAHLVIPDGRLRLLPRPHDRTQWNPIDVFFESIARWAQDRAIGVVLSGTASDGAVGIREIKAAGGITIAQKPETAKYDGMPRAAIATGMVDLVLAPREIAEHIGHCRQHPYLEPKAIDQAPGDRAPAEHELEELFVLLRRASGIDFRQYKTPTVRRRLLRRMALHRSSDVGSYLRHVRDNPAEAAALCQDLLIRVTRFFRDPESWKALEALALHEIASEVNDGAIRVWVPGCATGEEAYSVAMILLELLGDNVSNRRVQIFATDVSERAIEEARSGQFGASIAADVPPERLRRFFTKADGGYRVSKLLRDVCVFARHDLVRDPPFPRLDLIVCRNVLIYLDAPLQRRLMSVFQYALKPRGFLMLGAVETTGPQAAFTVVDKKWRIYRRAPVESFLQFALPATDAASELRFSTPGRPSMARSEGRSVQEEANRLLLDRYAPPGVVVDAKLEIVHFRGHTRPYLEAPTGEPSLNVLKMARGGLLGPLRAALNTARRKRRPVRKEGVQVQNNGDWQAVDLEVLPLQMLRGEYFFVLFQAPTAVPPQPKSKKSAARGRATGAAHAAEGRLTDLRRELAASREYLQSIIQELEAANDELQSANEEILSSNEELQSTNEELDTAKEELQSTNEELNTVNDELHSRNEELARVNSDLLNLLGSVDLPIVIVGDDLTIRRFTPPAERLFNLILGDVGRPIRQIKPALGLDELESLIRASIDGVAPREQEVRGEDGRWYSLRVRPYKGIDNRLDGAVVTAIDVDDSKRYQRQVERSRDYFMKIVESVKEPLLVLDSELRVRTANRSFVERYHGSRQPLAGSSFYELDGGRWDVAEMRTLLAAVTDGDRGHLTAVEQELSAQGSRRLVVSARSFELADDNPWILVAIEDGDAEEAR